MYTLCINYYKKRFTYYCQTCICTCISFLYETQKSYMNKGEGNRREIIFPTDSLVGDVIMLEENSCLLYIIFDPKSELSLCAQQQYIIKHTY